MLARRVGSSGRSSGSSGGGAAVAFKPPKPPTPDSWWAGADAEERGSWVLAYFIEHSDLFELGEPDRKNCALCLGQGLQHKILQSGQTWSYLCVRCGGAQRDKLVKYR